MKVVLVGLSIVLGLGTAFIAFAYTGGLPDSVGVRPAAFVVDRLPISAATCTFLFAVSVAGLTRVWFEAEAGKASLSIVAYALVAAGASALTTRICERQPQQAAILSFVIVASPGLVILALPRTQSRPLLKINQPHPECANSPNGIAVATASEALRAAADYRTSKEQTAHAYEVALRVYFDGYRPYEFLPSEPTLLVAAFAALSAAKAMASSAETFAKSLRLAIVAMLPQTAIDSDLRQAAALILGEACGMVESIPADLSGFSGDDSVAYAVDILNAARATFVSADEQVQAFIDRARGRDKDARV